MFFTIPTILTWTRIVAIPLIVGVFYLWPDRTVSNLIATIMFVVFALTDWLDGYLARKLNQTSAFGAFLDPVADKFLVCASLLVLVHLNRADVFVALIIIGREIAISALREWMAQTWRCQECGCAHAGQSQDHRADDCHPVPALRRCACSASNRHRRLGHLADLARRRADGLVDGVLPAKGLA
jgi:hypothetical protein